MADIVMADLVLANIVMAVAAEPRQAEVGGVHVRSPCVETCVSTCVYEGEQVCRGGCVAIAAWIDLGSRHAYGRVWRHVQPCV